MTAAQWLSLLISAGMLALSVVALLRLRASPLAPSLAAFGFACFAVRFSGFAWSLGGDTDWPYFVRPVYPLIPAVGIEFVLVFVGARGAVAHLKWVGYLAALGLGGLATVGFVHPGARALAESEGFLAAFASEMALSALLALWLLVRHLRSQCDATERLRTAMMLALAVVGALLAVVPYNFPNTTVLVGSLMLVALGLLTTVTFGLGVLETELKGLAAVYVVALLAIAAGGYAVAARLVASSGWLLVLGLALGAALVLLLAQVARALMEHHARTTQLTTLGRWSADMAHELKNPLAALKGAAQYLLAEAERGGTLAAQREMLTLLVSEADRMDGLIARYQRYGETPALRSRQSLNALAAACVERVASAGRGRAALHTELASSLPDCLLDLPLASAAIENALTNALEATDERGSVVVRTYVPDASAHGVAVLSVQDTGRGMTPRELAMAFVEPFSTKGPGRGRGLSLIKRSMESLGGEARVDSQLGRGTRVQLRFPVA